MQHPRLPQNVCVQLLHICAFLCYQQEHAFRAKVLKVQNKPCVFTLGLEEFKDNNENEEQVKKEAKTSICEVVWGLLGN